MDAMWSSLGQELQRVCSRFGCSFMPINHPVRHFEVKYQPSPDDTFKNVNDTIFSMKSRGQRFYPFLSDPFGERRKDREKEPYYHPFSCRPHDDRRLHGLRIDTATDKHGGTHRSYRHHDQGKNRLANDNLLKSFKISVETRKGIVALSGFVDSQYAVDKAGEIARGVEGVKSVENALVAK